MMYKSVRKFAFAGILCVCSAGVVVSATVSQLQPAAPGADARQELIAELKSNVARQREALQRARLMSERIGADERGILKAEQNLARALELLHKVSGQGRPPHEELVEAHAAVVARLERMLRMAGRQIEAGVMREADLAELSMDLAEARVALFELMR
jgi:hypothetical protein